MRIFMEFVTIMTAVLGTSIGLGWLYCHAAHLPFTADRASMCLAVFCPFVFLLAMPLVIWFGRKREG